MLWDSNNYSGIASDNTEIVPVLIDPFHWQIWCESSTKSNLSVITYPSSLEQLNLTNDESIYLWYRRNVRLTRALTNIIVTVETRKANALLFFLDQKFLGEFDNHDRASANVVWSIAFDLSQFKPNQQYLFEILSISLGVNDHPQQGSYETKGIVGNVWLDEQLLVDNQTEANFWQHQKGLLGEHLQIYTEQGSSQVSWDIQWTKGINQPVTWFQARFDLDHLIKNDTNVNPVLLDAQGLNRGHAFINGNDLGLYWLIQGVCANTPPCCCQQSQADCLKSSQRYYHIPSDWLKPKNNLITVFEDLGAPSPGSVGIVQRVVKY